MTPQAGIRVTHVTLGALPETGSELALDGHPIGHTASSLLARVELGFEPWLVNGWSVAPTATLGAELALGNTLVAGTASLYGFTINQYAAFDSRYLLQGGLGVGAQHGAFAMHAGLNMAARRPQHRRQRAIVRGVPILTAAALHIQSVRRPVPHDPPRRGAGEVRADHQHRRSRPAARTSARASAVPCSGSESAVDAHSGCAI